MKKKGHGSMYFFIIKGWAFYICSLFLSKCKIPTLLVWRVSILRQLIFCVLLLTSCVCLSKCPKAFFNELSIHLLTKKKCASLLQDTQIIYVYINVQKFNLLLLEAKILLFINCELFIFFFVYINDKLNKLIS